VLILAVAAFAFALAYAINQEIPVGTVQGRIALVGTLKPAPNPTVVIEPAGEEGRNRILRTVGGADGRFVLRYVPAGDYRVSAWTPAHSVADVRVRVVEGQVSTLSLRLAPSEPELRLAQHQRTFPSAQPVRVAVRGYVDGRKPVGTDVLSVRVYRTRLSQMLADPAATQALRVVGRYWDPLPRLPAELLNPANGKPPAPVWQRTVRIVDDDAEGFYYQWLDLGRLTPGLYLVEVRHVKAAVASWLVVTDTAFVVKFARGQVLGFAADAASGRPLPGSALQVYRNGKVIAEGRTGDAGTAMMSVPPGDEESEELITLAKRGDDETVVARWAYFSEGSGEFTAYAYTDRPLYRSGHRVYYKGIVRRNVETGVRYGIAAGEPVRVEVLDPTGERVFRARHQTNGYGSVAGHFDLSPEAPSGTYTMVLITRGERHTQDIVVAPFRKPEFSVALTPGRPRYLRGENVQVTVSATYFFGAPVPGGKVSYTILRSPDWFAEFADLAEDDERIPAGLSGEIVAEGQTALGPDGHAVITFRADVPEDEDSPQDYLFTVSAGVEDASGRQVSGEGTVRVAAGDFRLLVQPAGFLAAPGRPMPVTISARDYEGKPVAAASVEVETIRERWNQQRQTQESTSLRIMRVTTGPDGIARLNVIPPASGEYRVVARARDKGGRTIRGRAWLWAMTDVATEVEAHYAGLSVRTDKRRYLPGETARVLINTEHVGQTLLLTIEGQRIYQAFAVPVRQHSTVLRVPVRTDYGPNVFLVGTYVRGRQLITSEIPLRVSVPARDIRVSVQPDRQRYQPGDAATYQVTTADHLGRPVPAEFSLAVVDESIFALREDDPAGLRSTFYPRRYNAVNTFFSAAMEFLGDADKARSEIVERRRFKDTAYWNPFLQTDTAGRARVTFRLPDNLTTWRATAVAQTRATTFGTGVSKVVVAKPFFVRLETPRFLTEGDRARLLVIVHNETGVPQTAAVQLRSTGLSVEGAAARTVSIAPGQAARVEWWVTAPDPGLARIHATARASSRGGLSFSDGLEMALPVRIHGREQVTRTTAEIRRGLPAVTTFRIHQNAIASASRLVVRVTPSPAAALADGLEYLIGYPYGCIEQTMSRFLPDLLVQRVWHMGGGDPAIQREIPRMVRDGLTRIYRFQEPGGGWGWWAHDEANQWMTAYVLYGLAVARAEGHAISEDALRRGITAAAEMAKGAGPENKPFLLYALALAGDRGTAKAQRTRVSLERVGPEGLAYLVLLDRLLGGTGGEALSALERQAVGVDGMRYWNARRYHPSAWEENWDDRMVTAVALQALLAADVTHPMAPSVLRWLMLERTGDHWGNTRTTSWVLAALADYLSAQPAASRPSGDVRIRVNGQAVQQVSVRPQRGVSREIVARFPSGALRPGENAVAVEWSGGTAAFATFELSQTIALKPIPALPDDGVEVKREYLRLVPRSRGGTWSLDAEPTDNRARAGDRILVRLSVRVPRAMTYVVIEDSFPGGFEVVDQGNAEDIVEWGYWWTNIDVRDEKIAFFAARMEPGTHVIEYTLRAITPGTYRALPAMLQPMYVGSLRAESAETAVEIR
jgi:hypothetical protein